MNKLMLPFAFLFFTACGTNTSTPATLSTVDTLGESGSCPTCPLDSKSERFASFLGVFSEVTIPLECDDFSLDELPKLPDYALLEEFICVDDPNHGYMLSSVSQEMWNEGEYKLLSCIKSDSFVTIAYAFNFDDGYSIYDGIMLMNYTYDGVFIAQTEICGSADIEKSGYQLSTGHEGTIDDKWLITSKGSRHYTGEEEMSDEIYTYTEQVLSNGTIQYFEGKTEAIVSDEAKQ